MNYAYTSARVRALENSLPSPELIRSIADSGDEGECIAALNGAGFEGAAALEIISNMKAKGARLIDELIEDPSEIEVIFYENTFHNLKAAIKRIYSKSKSDMFYKDALISGEEITSALENGNEASLPPYMADVAREAYRALLRTGDGRLSDMMVDKACLEAMADFGRKTKLNILKSYVNETIAAADIKIALRAADSPQMLEYIVPCGYFNAQTLIKAVRDGALDEFLESAGFGGVSAADIDAVSEERIAKLLAKEKYDIFTGAPAVNFILEYNRAVSIIRYILICTANGTDKGKIMRRVSHYV